jgi:hypothetical protein
MCPIAAEWGLEERTWWHELGPRVDVLTSLVREVCGTVDAKAGPYASGGSVFYDRTTLEMRGPSSRNQIG